MEFFRTEYEQKISGHFSDIFTLVEALKLKEKNSTKQIYYRGQTRPWPIQSSVHRKGTCENDWKETQLFVNWLKNNESLSLDPENNWEDNAYLAVAQHYGYMTDLIDFTTDIEVAAYFASDYNSGQDSSGQSIGVIYCFTDDDISTMAYFFQNAIEEEKITNKQVIKAFENNQFSPFFSIKNKALSRLNNQAGLFLWDYKSFFTQVYIGNSFDCSFLHTEKHPYKSERVNRAFIYPNPNSLEREIERYIYPKNTKITLESEEFKNLSTKFKTIVITAPEKSHHILDKQLEELIWDDSNWRKIKSEFYPNNEIYIINSIYLKQNDINLITRIECENYVEEFIKIGRYAKFIGSDKTMAEGITDVISTLLFYEYTKPQIAETLFYTLKLLSSVISSANRSALNSVCTKWTDIPSLCCKLNTTELANRVYSSKIVKLGFSDEFGISSYGFVEADFINDNSKEYRKKQEQILKQYLNIEKDDLDNVGVRLMQLNTNPRKNFDFDDICTLFSMYILPCQFIFRNKEGRIYVPTYLKTLGLD